MKIKNISKNNRFCHNILIKAGDTITIDGEDYLRSVNLSPEVFEIQEEEKLIPSKKARILNKKNVEDDEL